MGLSADVCLNQVLISNFSKFCKTEQEAQDSVNLICAREDNEDFADYRQVGNYYVVYRVSDGKVLKNINYQDADFSALRDVS